MDMISCSLFQPLQKSFNLNQLTTQQDPHPSNQCTQYQLLKGRASARRSQEVVGPASKGLVLGQFNDILNKTLFNASLKTLDRFIASFLSLNRETSTLEGLGDVIIPYFHSYVQLR